MPRCPAPPPQPGWPGAVTKRSTLEHCSAAPPRHGPVAAGVKQVGLSKAVGCGEQASGKKLGPLETDRRQRSLPATWQAPKLHAQCQHSFISASILPVMMQLLPSTPAQVQPHSHPCTPCSGAASPPNPTPSTWEKYRQTLKIKQQHFIFCGQHKCMLVCTGCMPTSGRPSRFAAGCGVESLSSRRLGAGAPDFNVGSEAFATTRSTAMCWRTPALLR